MNHFLKLRLQLFQWTLLILPYFQGIILAAIALYAAFTIYQKRNNFAHERMGDSSQQVESTVVYSRASVSN